MPEQAAEMIENTIETIGEVTGLDPTVAGIAIVALVLVAVFIFTKPIRLIAKVLINTGIGFVALTLINQFGADFGIALGVNWLNAAVTGILGVPGVALLLILKWMALI